jgi:hypothetical protein
LKEKARRTKVQVYFKLLTLFSSRFPEEYLSLIGDRGRYQVVYRQQVYQITDKDWQEQLYTTGNRQIVCSTKIEGKTIRVIIDSGTTDNFINLNIAAINRIVLQRKRLSYKLTLADRENIDYNKRVVNRETIQVEIVFTRGYQETIQFDIVQIGIYQAILRIL